MSGTLRRHYVARGVHHTVLIEDRKGVLRVRIDREDEAHAHVGDARLIRPLAQGAEVWITGSESKGLGGRAVVVRHGDRVHVALGGRTYVMDVVSARPGDDAAHTSGGGDDDPFVASPMTGVVLSVGVAAGDAVDAGGVLCVVEAMKMEFAIEAPRGVVVDELRCAVGDRVDIGDVLVTFRPDDGT